MNGHQTKDFTIMKTVRNFCWVIALLTSAVPGWSQGFVNLNFENASIVPAYPPLGGEIVATNAIPGWTAYVGTTTQPTVFYNGVSIGGSLVSLNDTNASGTQISPLPIQGNYSVLLWTASFSEEPSVGIGQTGQIPNSANSLVFWATFGGIQVTFNGQVISFFTTGSTANYNIYAADISAYAGQTGELRFTTPSRSPLGNVALLDNIQFSSTTVPEPGTSALIALGGVSLALKIRKKYGNQSRP